MRWRPLAPPKDPDPAKDHDPGDPPLTTGPRIQIKCPDCGTSSSGFRMMEATTYWLIEFEGRMVVEEEVGGWRIACQRCPCVYHVDRDGSTFKPHALSLPQAPPRYREPPARPGDQWEAPVEAPRPKERTPI